MVQIVEDVISGSERIQAMRCPQSYDSHAGRLARRDAGRGVLDRYAVLSRVT